MTVAPALSVAAASVTRLDAAPALSSTGVAARGATPSGAAQLPAASDIPPQANPAVPAAINAPTVATAALAAAIRQDGLAVLMADLSQAQRIPGVPAPVQAAIGQVLALRAPLDVQPSAADIKAALVQSDPSLPAQPAAAAASAEAASAAVAPTPSTGTIKGALLDLQQALNSWRDTVPAQSPPLPASSAGSPATASRPNNAVPPPTDLSPAQPASGPAAPAQTTIGQPQAAPTAAVPAGADTAPAPVQPGPAAGTAPPAPALSPEPSPAASLSPPGAFPAPVAPAAEQVATPSAAGILAEPPSLPVAAVAVTAPASSPAAVGATPSAAEEIAPTPSSGVNPATVSPVAQPPMKPSSPDPVLAQPVTGQAALAAALIATPAQSVMPGGNFGQALQIFQQIFKSWFDSAPEESSPDGLTAAAEPSSPAVPGAQSGIAPPPPYRGGPTSAQPTVPSTLPLNADPLTVANRLTRETTAALAHQELLGIASLPAATPGHTQGNGPVSQWMFEIPFATPQGSAVAQFKVSRDGAKGGKGQQAPVWRANFSLDVEPMGPVHAQIILAGERSWVSLWAERDESVARLRGQEAQLTKALRDSDFVAEIAIHAGAPRQATPSNGQFLDHRS